MCELLIFVGNDSLADAKADRYCHKRGMPLVVKEDGAAWGREESKQVWIAEGRPAANWPMQGRLAILKIPGVPAAKAEGFIEPQMEDDAGTPYYETIPEANPQRAMYRLKAWRVLIDSVPLAIRNAVIANGEVSVTVAQIRTYLKRIRDDAQYTGLG